VGSRDSSRAPNLFGALLDAPLVDDRRAAGLQSSPGTRRRALVDTAAKSVKALSTWLGLSGIGACRGSVGWVSVVGQAAAVGPVTSLQAANRRVISVR
jgi:hypothetical protein